MKIIIKARVGGGELIVENKEIQDPRKTHTVGLTIYYLKSAGGRW